MPLLDTGALVRDARHRSGLTQRRLAERAGVHRQTVSQVESGAYRPTIATLVALLAAAGVQMRVELEPLDADVRREIADRRASPDGAKDVLDVWGSLFAMDEVAYRVEGLAAAALLGAPVSAPVIHIAFAETDATFAWLAAQVRGAAAKLRADGADWPLELFPWRADAGADSKEERIQDGVTVRERLGAECPDGRFWFEGWFDALAARLAPADEVARHVVVTTSQGPIAVQPLGEIDVADGDVARVLRVMREAGAPGDVRTR
jgi:transcriptional regulator with XRE-family HTH domain